MLVLLHTSSHILFRILTFSEEYFCIRDLYFAKRIILESVYIDNTWSLLVIYLCWKEGERLRIFFDPPLLWDGSISATIRNKICCSYLYGLTAYVIACKLLIFIFFSSEETDLHFQAKETYSQALYSSVSEQYDVLKSAIYGYNGPDASNSVVCLSQPWK